MGGDEARQVVVHAARTGPHNDLAGFDMGRDQLLRRPKTGADHAGLVVVENCAGRRQAAPQQPDNLLLPSDIFGPRQRVLMIAIFDAITACAILPLRAPPAARSVARLPVTKPCPWRAPEIVRRRCDDCIHRRKRRQHRAAIRQEQRRIANGFNLHRTLLFPAITNWFDPPRKVDLQAMSQIGSALQD